MNYFEENDFFLLLFVVLLIGFVVTFLKNVRTTIFWRSPSYLQELSMVRVER